MSLRYKIMNRKIASCYVNIDPLFLSVYCIILEYLCDLVGSDFLAEESIHYHNSRSQQSEI